MRNVNRNSDVARISSSLEPSNINFFKQWLDFIKPAHKLTDKETLVLATILQIRHDLSRNIKDEALLNEVLMSVETKRKIRQVTKVSSNHFQVLMTKLKQRKVIVDGKINPRYIPNVEVDSEGYKLIIYFSFKHDQG